MILTTQKKEAVLQNYNNNRHQPLPLISCVIPTYNETESLVKTMLELQKQTVLEQMEVVIADYDPEQNQLTLNTVLQLPQKIRERTRLVKVDRKGIAYARHTGIMNRNFNSNYIVNFDADAVFNRNDAIFKLVEPLHNGSAVLTCCDNQWNMRELKDGEKLPPDAFTVMQTVSELQRNPLLPVILEPGMCFTWTAYEFVGGFFDVSWAEGLALSSKIIFKYPLYKQWIKDVVVFSSPRRALGFGKYGLLAAMDYANAFRGSDMKRID